ncbi:MAG: helix-turn-helix domain-containing protein [Desulfobulbus sp.]|jgi:transcriptional regulator with XRE-family HTH domain|uniref:helix-turn-helix domain-containing protein n=1 Tax=Desulfobulbus sp. TaxID=895 RepID=UPI00283D9256|nr:helix-turn-helix transcriptional regulator [Desulfobulbus sp.]MDR2551353.1 helix-turn-helix domain-containing protein [Desulfobulbus sp.]
MENENILFVDGKKLRRVREQRKVTQLFLATAVSVSTETISRWENNRVPTIKRENALKLAEVLEVGLEELVRTNEPERGEISDNEAEKKGGPLRRAATVRHLALWMGGILLGLGCVLLFFLIRPVGGKPAAGEIRAMRQLPHNTLPGRPFPVVIKIEAPAGIGAFMLRETPPPGCTVVRVTPPIVDGEGTASSPLKWVLPGEQSRPLVVRYLVIPGAESTGQRLPFAGTLVTSRRGALEPVVEGVAMVAVSAYHWADENCDHRIDDYEILSVIERFPDGNLHGIDLDEIRAIWAGQGYRWHDESGQLEIIGQAGTETGGGQQRP